MGRAPCCDKIGLKKGRWTSEEDEILIRYISRNREGSWRALPKNAGLLRCGKSCRLRWINYLRSDLKRGNFTSHEQNTIIKLHASLGNKWSLIANQLPGRTDNEIKNYWNSTLSRRIDTFGSPALMPQVLLHISSNNNLAAASTDDNDDRVIGPIAAAESSSTPASAAEAAVPANKKRKGRTSRAAMMNRKKKSSSTNYKSDKPSSSPYHQQVAKQDDPYHESNSSNINTQQLSSTTTRSISLVSTAPSRSSSLTLPQTSSSEKESAGYLLSNSWTGDDDGLESLVLDSLLTCQNEEYRRTPQSQRQPAAAANNNELLGLDASCELGLDLALDGIIKNFDDQLVNDPCGVLGSNDNKSSINSCGKVDEEMRVESMLDSSKRGLEDSQISAAAAASFDLIDCAALSADWDYWDYMVLQPDDSRTSEQRLWSSSAEEEQDAGTMSWLWGDYANQQDHISNKVDKNNQKDVERRDAMVAWLLS